MRSWLRLAVLASFFVVSAVAAEVPRGKLQGSVTPRAYRLDLTIVPDRARFSGHVEIDVDAKGGERTIYLHGRDLTVRKVEVRQGDARAPATYAQVDASGVARLTLSRPLSAGSATLAFEYDAAFATGSAGLYRLDVGGLWYAWTQLEAIDARAVFPSFDEPGFKTPYTVSVTTAPGLLAVSNEAELGSTPSGALVKHTYKTTEPLPTYLVALAVGPFESLDGVVPPTPQRKQPLPLRLIATKGQRAKLRYAFEQTKPIVQLLEAYFDRPFPFSKLDQIASPIMGGAMENAGAVIYDDTLLVLGDDAPVKMRKFFGMVTAHELAHQWFGDLVTPAWWDDIWLNESFANWLGYRIAQQWNRSLNIGVGALDEALTAMSVDALRVGRPIRQTIALSGEIDSAFDPITYGKGGQVIAMVESYLGAEKFQRGVRLHIQRYAGKNATSDDFFRALADGANDPRLVTAMRSFVDQQGVPVVRVERSGAGLSVSQRRYVPIGPTGVPETAWTIPFCLRQGDAKHCTLLDGPRTTMEAKGAGPLVPNAGGYGYYRFSLTDADWSSLIASADSLTPAEALATIDSLWADFRAGGVGMPRLVQAARAFATQKDSNVVVGSGKRLVALRTHGQIPKGALPGYRRLLRELYGPRVAKLGFDPKQGAYADEDPDTQALRSQLVNFLAHEAQDDAIGGRLASAAAAWLDGDPGALDRTYLVDGLRAWLARAGLGGANRLWTKLIASTDAYERHSLTAALAGSADPAIARWALARFDQPGLRPLEKLVFLNVVHAEPATRPQGFAWLAKNFRRVARETNLSSVNFLFSVPEAFCDEAAAKRIEQALRKEVKALGRGALPLDRTVETVRNCAALSSARGGDIAAAMRAQESLEGS